MKQVMRVAASLCCATSLFACSDGVPSVSAKDGAAPVPSAAALQERCKSLTSQMKKWPDASTRLVQAAWRASGSSFQTPMGPMTLPAHCEVTAIMRERKGQGGQEYAIRFRMRLPASWNQRFFFQGGGGTNGDIGNAVGMIAFGAPTALDRGYAVVSQDSGHDNSINNVAELGGPVSFGFDPQARAEYGGASLKPVAEAAKALIRSYYDRDPQRSYFVGCSKGGQEGMMLAQRYPDVFDGIVAAAPGFSLPRAAVAEAWDTQAFASLIKRQAGRAMPDPGKLPATFTNEQFARVRNAVLEACDADDGVQDGITGSWSTCDASRVKPKLLEQVCTAAPDCLSRDQVDVIERVYAGAKDAKGNALYARWAYDGGIGTDGWRAWKIGPAGGEFPGVNVAMGAPALAAIFTTPPTPISADLSAALEYALGFDFDRDASKIYATDDIFLRSAWDDIGARSPDLKAFRARGAKMIVPHGVSDPVFSVVDTVMWYQEVDQLSSGKAAEFVRVFPVPGMAHCAGGPATDQYDAFEALVAWVEKSTPPDSIIARAGPGSPWPGRSRPLCPYPRVARYDGGGNVEDAASFRCE
jgi:pimeloyl-ACP methyl ester carboxylesterase